MIGFGQPALFYDTNETDKETFKEHTQKYLIVNGIVTICVCLPTIFLIREKPPKPTSRSQAHQEKLSLFRSIKVLLKNKSFIKLMFCDAAIIGYSNIYSTIINEVFTKYGLTDAQVSILGLVANIAGISGSVIFGIIIDKFRIYKKMFIVLIGSSIVCHFLMITLAEIFTENTFLILIFLMTSLIFCIVPITAISNDFLCELCYPIGMICLN